MIDLQFNGWLDTFWNFNLDLSVIVLTVLLVRFFIRKTTKSYNSYLLWLAIPVGFVFQTNHKFSCNTLGLVF